MLERILLFLAFSLNLYQCHYSNSDSLDSHLHRSKRSNIPCGTAFTPCNGKRPVVDVSQDQPLEPGPTREPGQFATSPNIRRQMLQVALVEAQEEVDRLFNTTEPQLARNGK